MSANYLEALERWDTGAVQIFMAQGLLSRWFWFVYGSLWILILAILAPSFTHGELMSNAWKHVDRSKYEQYIVPDLILLLFSAAVIFTVFIGALVLSYTSPGRRGTCWSARASTPMCS